MTTPMADGSGNTDHHDTTGGACALMIFRLTQKLNKKIDAGPLPAVPLDESPWGDWSARLFTADRTQYILLSNTMSLYSVVMFGRGITHAGQFIERAMSEIREFMTDDGLGLVYMNFVAQQTETTRFGKALNRSVTGSMNDLVTAAKIYLANGDIAPFEVGFKLNETPMTAIGTPESRGYAKPRDAAKRLMTRS